VEEIYGDGCGKMRTPVQFYKELGAEVLVSRKNVIHTQKELICLKKLLDKKMKILDLACGYGRFTIPLAKQGYLIEGIDISADLLKKAKKDAKEESLKIKLRLGDMRKLPYNKEKFDSVICMWSAFVELKNKSDQIKSIKEILRILKFGGFAFIEMTVPLKDRKDGQRKIGDDFVLNGNIITGKIEGVEITPVYNQNKKSLTDLMKTCKVKKYKVYIDNFGGRDRLLLQFWK